ncbi:MAG: hypothetical protein NTX85_01385 [Candidatus Nomurabacteria bacterium]|nr:hypothetical protein [Candidatus Nomurabacteria bacterium]
MDSKKIILICTMVGSFLGSIIPELWGDSMMSMTSILLTAVGGALGIYIGYKISQNY